MPVEGSPRFNAVTLLEMEEINFANRGHSLVGHGAFIDTRTGSTYGRTTCSHWSPTTLALLEELRASMEQDLASLVFETEGAGAVASSGGPLFPPDPGGIGEHAGTATEAPSV
jgi:hypothetical protein